jgi:N-acetylglucosamine kinase-like BadF-type ATPase
MALYLGLDGGGSKTVCVIGDDTHVIASAHAGPSNLTRVGEANARQSLHDGILQACAAAKIEPKQLCGSCLGVAGAGREEVAAVIRQIAAEVIPGNVEVVADMQIALQAAFGEGLGIVVIAGTGSIAFARDAQGNTARAGGWGFAISDEGSAHWIGRAAVAALLRARDQSREEQPLESAQLFRETRRIWNVDSFDQFVRSANSLPNFASLLPAIVAAAEADDQIARPVLVSAAAELAQLAILVAENIFSQQNFPADAIPVAMVGGVFRHAHLVRQNFCDLLQKLDSRLAIQAGVVDPVEGALQIARQSGLRN